MSKVSKETAVWRTERMPAKIERANDRIQRSRSS